MLTRPRMEQGALWPEHLGAVEAFLAVQGQWRVLDRFGERPHFLGLDYTAAEVGLRLAGIDVTPALWADLRIMEQGAREALNGD